MRLYKIIFWLFISLASFAGAIIDYRNEQWELMTLRIAMGCMAHLLMLIYMSERD
jgi:putative effector of murein hydrolase